MPSRGHCHFLFALLRSYATRFLLWTTPTLRVFMLGLVAAHVFLGESASRARMVRTFEAGGVVGGWPWESSTHWDTHRETDADARVARPELIADLAALLRPKVTKHYALVVGEIGTGKSTAVRAAVRSLPHPKGAVYFTTPEIMSPFLSGLGDATGYFHSFDPLARLYTWCSSCGTLTGWAALRRALRLAEDAYRAKHGRPAVLVIDHVEYIAKNNPAFFTDLQEFAKACAHAGSLRIVFVLSEGPSPPLPLMQASSAWSHALPPFEIPDIDDHEATEYLVDSGLDRSRAAEAVRDITGGRFILLLSIANEARIKSIESIRHVHDISTSVALICLGLTPLHALFRELSTSKRVEGGVARALLHKQKLDALLKANVLAFHPDGTYTAHARHVEVFLRDALASAAESPLRGSPGNDVKASL